MLILLYIAVDKFLHLDSINGAIFTVRYLKKDKCTYDTENHYIFIKDDFLETSK